jgi:DNA polymerase III delta prime subunit
MINITKILKQRYDTNKLAGLYLINPNIITNSKETLEWSERLISEITSKSASHSDILTIGTDKETGEILNRDFVVDEFKELTVWSSYNPLELSYKFVLIHNADKISKIIYNKLLKSFEEPTSKTVFLLINPNRKKLLETIESRALKLRPNIEIKVDKEAIIKVSSDAKQMSFTDFHARYKSEFDLVQKAISLKEIKNAEQSQVLINYMKQNEISLSTNNYAATRFYNSYNLLK